MRVAIVGIGPKGLFALERLLDYAHRSGSCARLEIDLFEPHPIPGAGPVYDPNQPGYLRLNFAADRLDLWWPHSRAVPVREQLSFDAWRQGLNGQVTEGERYPPRAQVGRYLADGFVRLLRHAPPWATIKVRATAVSHATKPGITWEVDTDAGATHEYDEVLVAVGHAAGSGQWFSGHAWEHEAPLIPVVFPVTRWLSLDALAPRGNVAVRGFALTFLDAALALTEGRGGTFEAGFRSGELCYRSSPDDVGSLLPFSRSGRPVLPKPEPELAMSVPALELIAASGRAELLALPVGYELEASAIPTLAETAAASLLAANGRLPEGEPLYRVSKAAGDWLLAAAAGLLPPVGRRPTAEIERALAVGAGRHRPNLQWALGHTWRSLYPTVVARLGGRGLADASWPAFRRLAAEMERISFGPPPINAAKLLALVAAGRVDLAHVRGGQIVTRNHATVIRSAAGECPVDAVVNAVLPEPGALGGSDGLPEQLVAGGYARILGGRRGLEVAADGGCIGPDGNRTQGLSAIGRPTEDSVIGNDTLSRTLHPQVDLWARRVVGRSLHHRANSFPRGVSLPREAA